MAEEIFPNPNAVYPAPGVDTLTQPKATVKSPCISVGDFTYFADRDFEKHVTHLYPWNGDRLVIGKFCQIAAGVEFVMNGANHQMNGATTFPFYIFEGWEESAPPSSVMLLRGDTVIGNDVWIGQNATILPGVRIGDGAIIGLSAVVGSDVPPYTVVAGNPAKPIRRRFDDEMIDLLERFRWWDKSPEEINALIPILTSPDTEKTRAFLREQLAQQ